jgi:hypothetical protein
VLTTTLSRGVIVVLSMCRRRVPRKSFSRVRAQRLPFYLELGSVFKGSPSVETNRRSGDSVDSLDADWAACDGSDDTPPHMFGQSSMGKGASNIDGGIIALNCTNAALVLNSGHPYSCMQWPQRFETNARFL